ncbi:hypothetical protein BJ508DRAFT_322706 [Ascobolus immersus RN42]|uniref:Uncharacterized protein n=1 Tax=Ascobolus immersus RN42 TaxID=1160509 RepID=A0A3N4IGJ5_ASCIM|nr:hypothetical protein BJ508DRAFT_322706 [Ascobolus immersus RN42]
MEIPATPTTQATPATPSGNPEIHQTIDMAQTPATSASTSVPTTPATPTPARKNNYRPHAFMFKDYDPASGHPKPEDGNDFNGGYNGIHYSYQINPTAPKEIRDRINEIETTRAKELEAKEPVLFDPGLDAYTMAEFLSFDETTQNRICLGIDPNTVGAKGLITDIRDELDNAVKQHWGFSLDKKSSFNRYDKWEKVQIIYSTTTFFADKRGWEPRLVLDNVEATIPDRYNARIRRESRWKKIAATRLEGRRRSTPGMQDSAPPSLQSSTSQSLPLEESLDIITTTTNASDMDGLKQTDATLEVSSKRAATLVDNPAFKKPRLDTESSTDSTSTILEEMVRQREIPRSVPASQTPEPLSVNNPEVQRDANIIRIPVIYRDSNVQEVVLHRNSRLVHLLCKLDELDIDGLYMGRIKSDPEHSLAVLTDEVFKNLFSRAAITQTPLLIIKLPPGFGQMGQQATMTDSSDHDSLSDCTIGSAQDEHQNAPPKKSDNHPGSEGEKLTSTPSVNNPSGDQEDHTATPLCTGHEQAEGTVDHSSTPTPKPRVHNTRTRAPAAPLAVLDRPKRTTAARAAEKLDTTDSNLTKKVEFQEKVTTSAKSRKKTVTATNKSKKKDIENLTN